MGLELSTLFLSNSMLGLNVLGNVVFFSEKAMNTLERISSGSSQLFI